MHSLLRCAQCVFCVDLHHDDIFSIFFPSFFRMLGGIFKPRWGHFHKLRSAIASLIQGEAGASLIGISAQSSSSFALESRCSGATPRLRGQEPPPKLAVYMRMRRAECGLPMRIILQDCPSFGVLDVYLRPVGAGNPCGWAIATQALVVKEGAESREKRDFWDAPIVGYGWGRRRRTRR